MVKFTLIHMKKMLIPIFIVLVGLCCAQTELPIIKANSKNTKIFDGLNYKPNFWYLMPEVKPDVYFVDIPRKSQTVKFVSDLDSISFNTSYGQNHDFIILLDGKDSCFTRISATYPQKNSSQSLCQHCPNDTIPFKVKGNKIYFSGKLNGIENIVFQFDLGAGAANISHHSVKKARVGFDSKGHLRNSDGNNEVSLSKSNTIELGSLKWEPVEMYETKNMERYEDAIVGNALFRDKIYEINYDKGLIILHKKLPRSASNFVKHDMLLDQGIRPAIEATFDFHGQKERDWFLFDTGNSSNGIVGNTFSAKNGNYKKFKKLIGFGDRKIAFLADLSIGNSRFSSGTIVLEKPNSKGSQYAFGGVIGNKILKTFNVIIDNQQGHIYLKPNKVYHKPSKSSGQSIFGMLPFPFLLAVLFLIVRSKIRSKRTIGDRKSAFFFILFLVFSCEKETLPFLDESLTTEFFIDSKEKNKTYRIWVQLPKGYQNGSQEYPTLYVLDPDDKSIVGNSNFFYIAKKCLALSEAKKTTGTIVIGIRHGDYREIDYTPTKFSIKGFSGEGGAEAFVNFIKKELIPKVEKDYRALSHRDQRCIIGHSLGGLCGAFIFANHNEAFGNYLLLSPTLVYDNEIVLQYEQQTRKGIKDRPQLVYLGLGGTEPNMVPAAELLYNRIKKYYPNAKSKLYIKPGKGHNSSKDGNIKNALEYYFTNRIK